MELHTVSFTYRQSDYDALVRVKIKDDESKEYHVTVMNGELEKMLYGNHVLSVKNGKFDILDANVPIEIGELRAAIASALETEIIQLTPSPLKL